MTEQTDTPTPSLTSYELGATAIMWCDLADGHAERDDVGGEAFMPTSLVLYVGWNPTAKAWGLTGAALHNLNNGCTRDFPSLGNARDPHEGMPEWLVPLVDQALTEIIDSMTPTPPGPAVVNL